MWFGEEHTGKFHITIRTRFGEVGVDGDTKEEALDFLKDAISIMNEANLLIPEGQVSHPVPTAIPAINVKKELAGIIETTADGHPQIIVPPSNLGAKDVIGLLLYWAYPNGFSIKELTELVNKSWKAVEVTYVGATIAGQMKGLVLKEGAKGSFVFKLSGTGKNWVENEIIPKARNIKK